MKKYRGVIDTNILFAGLYSASGASHQILRYIDNNTIVPILSTTLLFEYEDILKRNQKKLELTSTAIEQILNAICKRGEEHSIHFLWRPQLSDPKDDHILELSVAAGCADIVTFNIRDFANAESFGIRIIKPDLFINFVTR